MSLRAQISQLTPRTYRTNVTVPHGASVQDITQSILSAEPEATFQADQFAHLLKGRTDRETAQNIHTLLSSLNYQADGFKHQKIKLPSALMATGTGDCKSYALFAKAVCNSLNVPSSFCVTTYNFKPENEAHIYTQTNSGVTIDGTLPRFNYEAPGIKTKNKYSNMTKVSVMGNAQPMAAINGPLENVIKSIGDKLTGNFNEIVNNNIAVKTLREQSTQGIKPVRKLSILFFRAIRFIILLAFRSNINGIASLFKIMDDKSRYPIYRIFYALGGNTQQALWPAVNAGANLKPLKVKSVSTWFSQFVEPLIKNKDVSSFDTFQGLPGAAWKGSKINAAAETAVTGGAAATALGVVLSIVTLILAWAEANPEQAEKIIDKITDNTDEGGTGQTQSDKIIALSNQGYTPTEIADLLKINIEIVKTVLARGGNGGGNSSILPLGILAALAFS